MSVPTRILVFAEYGWCNGGENSWLSVAEILKNDFEIFLACPDGTELASRANVVGIETIDWRLHRQDGVRKQQADIRDDILKIIHSLNPGLVHSNSLATSRLVCPVASNLSIPSIGHLRDIMKLSKKAIADINLATAIIAVSNATKTFHVKQGLSAECCRVIYNGVDLGRFKSGNSSGFLHRELLLNPESKLLLCVGQIGLRKGTDTVIEAYQTLAETFEDLALILVGMRNSEKEEAVEFEDHCRDLAKKTKHVYWLGRRDDVPRIMNESTLLLHGARQEPLGRVLLESLASRLPFIATGVGGTGEIVADNQHQDLCLCSIDQPILMAQKAAFLLQNHSIRQNISTAWRNIATDRFDIVTSAEKISRLYGELA